MTNTETTPIVPEQPEGRVAVSNMMRSAVVWNVIGFVASQGAAFLIFLVLAAELPPEVFGVVALASIAADFIANDGRSACMDSIMQAQRYDKPFLSTAFFTFMGFTLLVALGTVTSAPLVANALDMPLIQGFMFAFALMILPTPWLAVMDAILMHRMDYRRFTERNIAGTIVSGVVGIALTFTPWAIWALVAQRGTSLVVSAVLEYSITRWRPALLYERSAALDFLRRYISLWLISILSFVVARVSTLVFGLRYDAATVGLIRAASRLTDTLQGPLITPLMGAWFPLMSKVRGDILSERHVYNGIVRAATMLALPVFAGLAIVSDEVVAILLPQRYAEVGPLLRATAITLLLIPICWFNPIGLASLGMNRVSVIYCVASVVVSLVALLAVPHLSPAAVLIVIAVPTLPVGVVGNVLLNRRLGQSNLTHYAQLLPPALGTVFMALCAGYTDHVMDTGSALLRLTVTVLAGAVSYGGWMMIFHRGWVMERVKLLRQGRA